MRNVLQSMTRATSAIAAGLALAAASLVAAPAHASACAAGDICTVLLDGTALRELGTTGTYFTGASGTGDGYTVTASRDASSHDYSVVVAPIGAATFTPAQTFAVTFVMGVGDTPTFADGRLSYVDYSIIDAPSVNFVANPAVVSDCVSGTPDTCTVATSTVLEAHIHYGATLATLASASWSSPAFSHSVSADCPQVSHSPSSLGVTISLGGPETQQDASANTVDSLLRFPDLAAQACWGVDADTLVNGLVLVHAGALAAQESAPSGASQYGVDGVIGCGGACVSLADVPFPAGASQTYLVAYAYRSISAAGFTKSYLAKKAVKRQGLTKKNTRNWVITLNSATSSPACIQNGNAVSALRLGSQGANVVCKYSMSFQRKAGKKWKTQRVGGTFVAR